MTTELWIKVDLGERGQIGPGKVALLEAIGREHSIAGAARTMGMSYRRAWLLVEQMNATVGGAVIATHMGGRGHGGAELTQTGSALVATYRELQQRAGERLQEELAALIAVTGD